MERLSKNRLFTGKLAVIILVSALILSCGGTEKTVKNGRIKLDESITLGQAFGNYAYFKNVKWESFKDEQGRKIVQVTGEIDMEDMFILENEGMTIDMLQGQFFEEGLLNMLLNQTARSENQGQNIISAGNVQEIIQVLHDHQKTRNMSIEDIVNNYESDPQKYQKFASDFIVKHQNTTNKSYLIELAVEYIQEVYGDAEPYMGFILEQIRNEYHMNRKRLEGLAHEDLYESARVEVEHPSVFYLKDSHIPALKLYSEGKADKGFEAYDEVAGYLKTVLKKNKGSYTCQFAVEDKSFRYYAGVLSITLAVDGVDEPVTFDLPESIDNLPYLIAIYGNRSFVE